MAGITPDVRYSKGLLTLKADKTPLLDILKAISEAAAIDVLISKDFIPADLSIQFTDQPLESALKRVLQGASYVAVYDREGDAWCITVLKVFASGQAGGEMVSLSSLTRRAEKPVQGAETKTVFFPSEDGLRTHGQLEKMGHLVPARTVPAAPGQAADSLNAPWFALLKQFERAEAREYEEMMLLKRKIETGKNPDRHGALALAYADKVEKFYTLKKVHLNKIEALKRIYQAREMVNKE